MFHIKTILKQAYNNFAEYRDQSEIEPWKLKEREIFLYRLNLENKKTLLEIGAGTGRDSLFFQQQGLKVTTIDFAEEMIRLCLEKGLDARIMDFTRLEFPSESFDSVYALNCLIHVPKSEFDGVLEEIRKVLKPDGLFFLGMYGGKETEGIWEDDFYEPKRFFAMYKDETILEIVQRKFALVDFHTVDMGAGAPHFQSILLRKS